ncbi:hypothetical protein [Peribacillus simplex]|nr:hypothetical protein [Peribacillus simplex]
MNEGRDPFVSSLASDLNMRLTRLEKKGIFHWNCWINPSNGR